MAVDRRRLFRAYMRCLDPSGDPAAAIAEEFYVSPGDPVSRRIATRLELEPTRAHLLLGGIGSGKTTELLKVCSRLKEVEDIEVRFVDVAARYPGTKLRPGVLLAVAALQGIEVLARGSVKAVGEEALEDVARRVKALATGFWDEYGQSEPDWASLPGGWEPGVLSLPEVDDAVRKLTLVLAELQAAMGCAFVVVFDGMDRVFNTDAFARLVAADVPSLTAAGVGTLVVGPQLLRFRHGFFVRDLFAQVHLQPAVAVGQEVGRDFLLRLLRARATSELLPDESAELLVRASGGVLRDLIAMAQDAGASAYSCGATSVTSDHVAAAVERFGRGLLLGVAGLSEAMARRLGELVEPSPTLTLDPGPLAGKSLLTLATDVDLELLAHRLLVELPGPPTSYMPHPAIVPLIPGLRQRSA